MKKIAKKPFLGLLCAVLFSLFIYLEYFHITNYYINTLSGFSALFLLFSLDKRAAFFAGFFIGVLWFYWIAFSFRYYDISYLIPVAVLGLGLAYGFFFYLFARLPHPIFKALFLIALGFIEPFGFNWFKPEVLFVNSYFSSEWYAFIILVGSIALFYTFTNKARYLAFLSLIFIVTPPSPSKPLLPELKLKIVQGNLAQSIKWDPRFKHSINNKNFEQIELAIKEGYEAILFPESAYVSFLNMDEELLEKLSTLSHKISIITGALYYENKQSYNATYVFEKGELQLAKKHVLVPFGEYIPLPTFIRDFINNTFYNGAEDYQKADAPSSFLVKGIRFRNAICYEASSKEIYTDKPKFVLASSNNAWFTPSIEPVLQHLLIKLYAKRNNSIVFHSVNGSKSEIIFPN